MDNLEGFIAGNLLMIIFCATVLLSLILFLFYLRCIVNSFIHKRHTASSSSSSTDSGLRVVQQSSKISQTTEGEYETETAVLMMPRQDSGLRLSTYSSSDTDSSHFFRLPSDRRKDSYIKFSSVDDLDFTKESAQCYLTRDTRPVTYFGRKGRRLYRKGTWEKALFPNWVHNQTTEYKKRDEVVGPIVKFQAANGIENGSLSTTTTLQIALNDFEIIGTSCKEVLI